MADAPAPSSLFGDAGARGAWRKIRQSRVKLRSFLPFPRGRRSSPASPLREQPGLQRFDKFLSLGTRRGDAVICGGGGLWPCNNRSWTRASPD